MEESNLNQIKDNDYQHDNHTTDLDDTQQQIYDEQYYKDQDYKEHDIDNPQTDNHNSNEQIIDNADIDNQTVNIDNNLHDENNINIGDERNRLIENNHDGLNRFANYSSNFILIVMTLINSTFIITGFLLFFKHYSTECNIIWLSLLIAFERIFEIINIINKNYFESNNNETFRYFNKLIEFMRRILVIAIVIWYILINNSSSDCVQAVSDVWKLALSYLIIIHIGLFIIQMILIFIIGCGLRLLFPNIMLGAMRSFPVRIGASDDELKNLKTYYFSDNRIILFSENFSKDLNPEDAKCSICFDEYKENDNLRLLNCNHHYHINCCDDWLKINKTCPMCREEVVFN